MIQDETINNENKYYGYFDLIFALILKIRSFYFVKKHTKISMFLAIISLPIWSLLFLTFISIILLFYVFILTLSAIIVLSILAIYIESFILIISGIVRVFEINLYNGIASIGFGLIGVGLTSIILKPTLILIKKLYIHFNAPIVKLNQLLFKEK